MNIDQAEHPPPEPTSMQMPEVEGKLGPAWARLVRTSDAIVATGLVAGAQPWSADRALSRSDCVQREPRVDAAVAAGS